MKKPEEIKKGLACCVNTDCKACPYDSVGISNVECLEALVRDAFAYTTQIEARVTKWISVEGRKPEGVVLVANFAPGTDGYKKWTLQMPLMQATRI